MNFKFAGVAGLVIAFSSCNIIDRDGPEVDRSLLAYASESSIDLVTDERMELSEQRDLLAQARQDAVRAELSLELAQDELDLAEERTVAKRTALELTREPGGNANLERAEQEVELAEAQEAAAEAAVALREQELERAQAQVELLEAGVALAEAEVELAKARAVADVDRPDVDEIDIDEFTERVRACETEVRVAEVRLEAADEEVQVRAAAHDQANLAVKRM